MQRLIVVFSIFPPLFHKLCVLVLPTTYVQTKVSALLPLMIFGFCSLIGSLAAFWLPETAGHALPQEPVLATRTFFATTVIQDFHGCLWLI